MQIEKSVRGSLFGITRLCRVMLNSDPEGRIFLSAPNNHDRFFFLHTLWSPAFDFNVGVELRDVLYNQCCFLIYPRGRIMVCKISFVSTGENRGKSCLVCKKLLSLNGTVNRIFLERKTFFLKPYTTNLILVASYFNIYLTEPQHWKRQISPER